jgi:3-deoxy-D-manno-octulosonic-acid transferase
LLDESGLSWSRRSKLNRKRESTLQQDDSRDATHRRPILLVDTVGELGAWWGVAHIAFVGGSFGPRGGQNMIEPAAYGAAVSFGPNTRNFRDIVAALLAAEAAVTVSSVAELEAFVQRCLEDRRFATTLGHRAQSLVQSQLGATRRTIRLLDALFDDDATRPLTRRSAA